MLLEVSKVVGLPVGFMEEGRRGAQVSDIVFDPSQMKIIGFLAKGGGFWSSEKVIALSDVLEVDAGGVAINSVDDLLDKEEIVRVGELLKKKTHLLGLRVYDKEEKYLGRVYDGVFEAETGYLFRIYVKNIWRKYIFERKQINSIDNKKIVIDTENTIKDRVKATGVPEAV